MTQPPASFSDLQPGSQDSEPLPARQPAYVRMPAQPPVATYALIGFTVFIYLLQMLGSAMLGDSDYGIDWVTLLGARISEAIDAGQFWRLISPVFLHGSFAHIFFNMYALFSVGGLLERHFGRPRFLLLYFLGAFSGNVLSYLFTPGYSVGASTAVFGLITAEAIFFYQNRELFGSYARQAIGNAVFIIVINLFFGLAPNIDMWGHVGGLLGGAMFAWFAGPKWTVTGIPPEFQLRDEREAREVLLGASLVALIFGGLAAWRFLFPGLL
ncbi:MAG: rhomboid family intramembrane serine protease [Chloroflexi bacterium]|nr:rhomboid family intramembrane serine protease [Chloroflexota bacterium]